MSLIPHRTTSSDSSPLSFSPLRETPDIETASDDYARRFDGAAGRFFLDVQAQALGHVMTGLEGSTVLEVGGGHGQLVADLLRLASSLTMLGSDDVAHAKVRSRFPGAAIEYATGDIVRLPYPDKSFDVVVAVRLLAHIESWETLIDEMCRVAKRSVIVDFPSWRSLNALTPLLFRFKKSIEGNTRAYRSFSASRLATVFKRSGFELSSTYGQFFLPMFVHRACRGAAWLRACERAFRSSGATSVFGSPVLLRADRFPRLVWAADAGAGSEAPAPDPATENRKAG